AQPATERSQMPVMLERRQFPVDGSENLLRQVINILRPYIITAEPLMDERRIEVHETFPGGLITGRLAQSFQQAVRGLGHGNSLVELQEFIMSLELHCRNQKGAQKHSSALQRRPSGRITVGSEILYLPSLGRTKAVETARPRRH